MNDYDKDKDEKLKFLYKGISKLGVISQEIHALESEKRKLEEFIEIYRTFLEELNETDVVNLINEKIKQIKSELDNNKVHNYNESDYVDDQNKPTILETKEIAKLILNDVNVVPTTVHFKELIKRKGYSVKLNTLRYVLSRNKDFEYDAERGGWRLNERQNMNSRNIDTTVHKELISTIN